VERNASTPCSTSNKKPALVLLEDLALAAFAPAGEDVT